MDSSLAGIAHTDKVVWLVAYARPGGWSSYLWTTAPSPSGYIYISLYEADLNEYPGDPRTYVAAVV